MFKVGERKKFLSPKHDYFIIKEIIEDPDIQLDYEFDGGICPDCKKKCKIARHFDLKRIYLMEDDQGEIGYKGEMADGELVRMPEGNWNADKLDYVKDKIKKAKEK